MLRVIPLFSMCSPKELARIEQLTTLVEVSVGTVLAHKGAPGNQFFVISSGVASVWHDGIQLDELGPGSFFGEVSLLDRGPRTATVIADTDMVLLVMSCREFTSMHFRNSAVQEQLLGELSRRLRRADQKLAQVGSAQEGMQ